MITSPLGLAPFAEEWQRDVLSLIKAGDVVDMEPATLYRLMTAAAGRRMRVTHLVIPKDVAGRIVVREMVYGAASGGGRWIALSEPLEGRLFLRDYVGCDVLAPFALDVGQRVEVVVENITSEQFFLANLLFLVEVPS